MFEKMRLPNLLITCLAGAGIACAIIHFSKPQIPPRNDATRAVSQKAGPVNRTLAPAPPVSTSAQLDSTGSQFLTADPDDTNGQFAAYLDGLCRSGQCLTAFTLARDASTNLQATLLKIIFNRWAKNHPEEATKSLDSIADSQLHGIALRALADGWNMNHPGDLAAYAFSLPSNCDRDYALKIALNNWSQQDPAALGEWLNSIPRGSEFDDGAALMLQKTDEVNRPPEVAMAWVENISDPTLRQDAFLRVFTEWMQTDPATAQQYLASSKWLSATERSQIPDSLSTPPPTTPASD